MRDLSRVMLEVKANVKAVKSITLCCPIWIATLYDYPRMRTAIDCQRTETTLTCYGNFKEHQPIREFSYCLPSNDEDQAEIIQFLFDRILHDLSINSDE